MTRTQLGPLSLALLLALVGCAGDDAMRGVGGEGVGGEGGAAGGERPAAPPGFFEAEVLPILAQRCASTACHGVPPGVDHGVFGDRYFGLPLDDAGQVSDPAAALASALLFVDAHHPPRFSSLLRKIVAPAFGGEPHSGGATYDDLTDPEYLTLETWVAAQTDGGEGFDPAELSELERLFARTVLPVLRERRCMTSNCHGPMALLTTLRLEPGVDGAFSSRDVRTNYAVARRFLHLDGPVGASRLLLKALPFRAGGLLHKGGNDQFFRGPEDPAVAAIAAWARAEQAAELGDEPSAAGVVFVRGPIAPRMPFALAAHPLGAELVWRGEDGREVVLSADLHDGPADVRDPAVSHDGTRIAFALRRGPDDGLNLYERPLAGGPARPLTQDGPGVFNAEPAYGPDGLIYFVSNRSGEPGDRGLPANLDLYALDPASGEIRRRTYGPNAEVRPFFLRTAGTAGELAFTSTRRAGPLFNAPIFRFPPDLHTEYHVHFGTQLDGTVLHGVVDTPMGLHVAAALPETDAQVTADGGRLVAIDRNFGPDIPDPARVAEASMPRFEHTLTWLTAADEGRYRDPWPLPDGRLLVSHDPDGDGDYGIWVLTLGPDPETGRTEILGRAPLVDTPDRADLRPVVVAPRRREPVGAHPHEDWSSPTGFINTFDLPLLQAITETLEPRAKRLRDDLRSVRIVAAAPPSPADGVPLDPATVRNGDPQATPVTAGLHDPKWILGTVPLGPDGSFYVEIPANLAVRFQALDENRMVVGTQHERWIFANPGEVLFHSTHRDVYRQRCAGCHGSIDGLDSAALGPVPDAITRASVSHSTHDRADPLEPLAPVPVGLERADWRSVDFVRDVQPILDASCAIAGCHAGPAPAGGLSLTGAPTQHYTDAYESLHAFGEGSGGGKRYVDGEGARARASYLVEKITGQEMDAPRDLAGACPPPGSGVPPLDAATLERVVEWIELGATFRGAE